MDSLTKMFGGTTGLLVVAFALFIYYKDKKRRA